MGRIALDSGNVDLALILFARAIELSPKMPLPHIFHALTLAKLGRYQEAIDEVKDEYAKNPTDEQLRFIMGISEYKRGNWQEAKKYFEWDEVKGGFVRSEQLQQF